MANTTNFNWETPDDTDLVKDGAAAIRTLGSAIDTSLVDLKGGTTGQILSKTSNTDMDFTWIANDQGDITGITATTPLTGGGTSGAITVGIQDGTTAQKGAVQLENSTSSTSTTTAAVPASVKSAYDLADGAIAKTTLTTAGDIIYRNATVPTRLAIGTAGQVLKVNSGATAPEWATASAGALTKITSGTGTSVASITVDNAFNSSYKNYFIIINGIGTASDNFILTLRTSGSDITTTNYNHQLLQAASTTVSGSSSTSQSKWIIGNLETVRCSIEMTIFNPQESVATTFFSNNPDNNDSATAPRIVMRSGNFSGTNQFDGFKIAYSGGSNFTADVVVYGLEK
jgi:hypothetical protein